MKTCLLDIRHTGEERHKNFVRECLDNPKRFEEPIKRVKLLTFKQDDISNRRSTNRNIAELKCSRDMMGRFLIFAPKRHLDLSHVFTFPLTPVPLSLCYCDGTMAKTEKTALFRHLESKVESSFPSPASVDACVVDGSFQLRVYFLRIYPQRSAGSPQQSSFKQRHCQANVSTLSSTHTKSPSFKTELPIFLLNEWKEQAYAHIIYERHVYVRHLGECLHFFVEDGVVRHDTIDVLGCNHAEADTRICLHTKVIDDAGNDNNVIIRASDTDFAVIMLHHAWIFSATLWMDTGTTNGKN